MPVKNPALRAASIVTAACAASLVLTAMPAHSDPVQAPPGATDTVSRETSAVEHPQGKPGPLQGPRSGRSSGAPAAQTLSPITRSTVIARAKTWVDAQVPYSQSDYRDGYRTDCSGLVSMAWNLGTNAWTGDLDTYANRITKSELRKGDMLLFHNAANPVNGSHVVLFESWTDSSMTSYIGIEQTRPHGLRRVIPYAYFSNSGSYIPYRYKNIVEDVVTPGDAPVAGNWDGGPAANVGVFRPSTGQFHLRYDDGTLTTIDWGQTGDLPVSANWDGTGPDNLGVFRPSTGQFHLRNDNGTLTILDWGQTGDLPVAANWDGGAASNIGIWRNGTFHLRNDNGTLTTIDWGQTGDLPVTGNWDGTGPDNLGVFRPSTGQFHLRNDNGTLTTLDWGQTGDLPVAANWDGGNGAPAANIGIWRPSQGRFHLRNDNGTLTTLDWGQPR
ncbi:C40 family peptidase [Streptomyces subrutilus]|uniref:NlpC/P60 domain-containing protein n=1 Tax=Streptomyces subrutilus TaxID=36818 RepID=A0A5P2UMV8_9ACTN|nr:C40 family peptidase [Streptomyces subrutilus]QEU79655.1 hypothetical protein CP968_16130 [Streptomyces subrutilus]